MGWQMPSFARVKEKLDIVGQKILGPIKTVSFFEGAGWNWQRRHMFHINPYYMYIYIFITWKIDIII